jgi:hypothetical protein
MASSVKRPTMEINHLEPIKNRAPWLGFLLVLCRESSVIRTTNYGWPLAFKPAKYWSEFVVRYIALLSALGANFTGTLLLKSSISTITLRSPSAIW